MGYYEQNWLMHHGVKGQRWGQRRAAWYPIAAYEKSVANGGATERVKGGSAEYNGPTYSSLSGSSKYSARQIKKINDSINSCLSKYKRADAMPSDTGDQRVKKGHVYDSAHADLDNAASKISKLINKNPSPELKEAKKEWKDVSTHFNDVLADAYREFDEFDWYADRYSDDESVVGDTLLKCFKSGTSISDAKDTIEQFIKADEKMNNAYEKELKNVLDEDTINIKTYGKYGTIGSDLSNRLWSWQSDRTNLYYDMRALDEAIAQVDKNYKVKIRY